MAMADDISSASSPCLLQVLPQIRKEHARHIKISSSLPSLISESSKTHATETEHKAAHGVCLVCRRHEARYTCPRCEIPYCSLDCYRVHDSSNGGKSLAGGCTEAFYQDRVSNVVNLEAKEQIQHTQNMIQRIYQNRKEQNELIGESELSESRVTEGVSQAQLLSFLQALEEGHTLEELHTMVSSFSPYFQRDLDHAIRSGHVQEWIIEPWHPWWKPELVMEGDLGTVNNPMNDEEQNVKTLDDRIVEDIKPFSELRPNSRGSDLVQTVDLSHNLVDILFTVVAVLQLFHGVRNAACFDNCIDAAETMINASPVLSQDARWECLEEVLVALSCAPPITASSDNQGDNLQHPSWCARTDLLRDVALILHGKFRLVARALFEATDILQSAISVYSSNKQAKDKNKKSPHCGITRTQLKRILKKIQFFLSWTRHYQNRHHDEDPLPFLAEKIEIWIAEWNVENAMSATT